MIKKILNMLGFAGKTVKSTIDKSTDFIDDALESEYITGTIDKAKEATGAVAEKAGELYEKGRQKAEEIINEDTFEKLKNSAEELGKDISETASSMVDKGKEIADKAMENEKVKSAYEKVKDIGEGVVDKAEDLIDKAESVITGDSEEE